MGARRRRRDRARRAASGSRRRARSTSRPSTPTKIIAVHLTYRSRVEEYAARSPPQPSYFMKPPTTLNGHRGEVRRPAGARFLNYEGELAVVIGRAHEGRRPRPRRSTTSPATRAPTTSACTTSATPTAARCCASRARTASCRSARRSSPASEFDPTDFTLRTYLNGEVVQEAHASDLIFGVAYQLADLSPADHARARRRRPHRHAGQLAADGARRRRRGRDRRPRPADEHRRRLGRRPDRAGRAARGLGATRCTSRSPSPRTRPSAWPRRAPP